MKELQRKQRMKQILYSYPVLCFLAIICFLLAKGAVGVLVKERESALRVENLEVETEAMVERETELKESIARLGTEEGIMEEIKAKFSVTREGEYVAIIVNERPSATSTKDLGDIWYKRLWRAIMPLHDK